MKRAWNTNCKSKLRNNIAKFSGTIQMVIGPTIDPKGKTANEITNEVEQWIEDTVDSLPKPD